MNAAAIAGALHGRKRGSAWTARCPAHDDRDPSLSISISKEGKTLIHCHAGCSQDRVIEALTDLGLGNRRENPDQARLRVLTEDFHVYEAKRQTLALEIWNSTVPAIGTLAETYLAGRAVTLTIPERLRFHDALAHTPTGTGAIGVVNGEKVIVRGAADNSPFESQGTLADWNASIGYLVAGHVRAVFEISAAFSAPLLKLLRRASTALISFIILTKLRPHTA